jgi:sensor histidine kinase regulating citrate/malate metabolism
MCKVLSNLIDNAIDAMEELPSERRRLTIRLSETLKRYCFSVSNTGAMIPSSLQESIFQPGVSTKGGGYGMGLYIVRKTLNDRGGDIALSSTEERTEFSGYIPRAMARQTPTE